MQCKISGGVYVGNFTSQATKCASAASARSGLPSHWQKNGRAVFRQRIYIFSGAAQPMRVMAFRSTERVVSASFNRADRRAASSPLMRQAL